MEDEDRDSLVTKYGCVFDNENEVLFVEGFQPYPIDAKLPNGSPRYCLSHDEYVRRRNTCYQQRIEDLGILQRRIKYQWIVLTRMEGMITEEQAKRYIDDLVDGKTTVKKLVRRGILLVCDDDETKVTTRTHDENPRVSKRRSTRKRRW